MPHVMLKKDWSGNFRRTVKAADGNPKVLTFAPGEPLELDHHEVRGVAKDIGKALLPVALVEGRFRAVELTDADLARLQSPPSNDPEPEQLAVLANESPAPEPETPPAGDVTSDPAPLQPDLTADTPAAGEQKKSKGKK